MMNSEDVSRENVSVYSYFFSPLNFHLSADSVMMMLRCQNVNIVDKINTSSALSFQRKTSITSHPREHKEINSRRQFIEYNEAINMNKDSFTVKLDSQKSFS
jgi:hypothetical protein